MQITIEDQGASITLSGRAKYLVRKFLRIAADLDGDNITTITAHCGRNPDDVKIDVSKRY